MGCLSIAKMLFTEPSSNTIPFKNDRTKAVCPHYTIFKLFSKSAARQENDKRSETNAAHLVKGIDDWLCS